MLDDLDLLGAWWGIERALELAVGLLNESAVVTRHADCEVDTVLFEVVHRVEARLQLEDARVHSQVVLQNQVDRVHSDFASLARNYLCSIIVDPHEVKRSCRVKRQLV